MTSSYAIFLLIAGLALTTASETPDGSPDCTVYWVVPETCAEAQYAFRIGVMKWNLNHGCRQTPPADQMCEFYMMGGRRNGHLDVPMIGLDPNIIRVFHVYLPEVYLEVMAFNFTSTADGENCFITGESTSVAYADNNEGQTYCAMERIMIESGMPDMDGYAEYASDDTCPNYSDAACYTGNSSRS